MSPDRKLHIGGGHMCAGCEYQSTPHVGCIQLRQAEPTKNTATVTETETITPPKPSPDTPATKQ